MKIMKLMLLTGLAILALPAKTFGSFAIAQGNTSTTPNSSTAPDQGQIELTRTAIRAQRRDIIRQTVPLTEEESQKFWPLYGEYRSRVASVNDSLVKLLTDYAQNYGSLTDAQAKAMLDDYLKYQKQKLALQQQYVQKFRQILPNKKVTRFFQVENKLDAVDSYDLAGSVPLVK
ncbi:MAG: hypothetical protein JO235_03855 [Chroococcidiopsidaceae cyanobacterium CP_BM_RX_35]|nr:hypothetical protein [Chroococcidiopsidaceae cyanobacterium CP_BM_RX_35]